MISNKSATIIVLFAVAVVLLVIAGAVQFRSIEPEPGQSSLRNEPGETWGTGFRKEGEERSLPPNARPDTPSGARDAPSQSGEIGNAPTGRGDKAPMSSDRK